MTLLELSDDEMEVGPSVATAKDDAWTPKVKVSSQFCANFKGYKLQNQSTLDIEKKLDFEKLNLLPVLLEASILLEICVDVCLNGRLPGGRKVGIQIWILPHVRKENKCSYFPKPVQS